MIIEKAKLDEAIRLSKKYYRTGDRDLITPLLAAEDTAYRAESGWFCTLLTAITLKRLDYNEPYQTYYDVLRVLGFEIVDGEEVST